ncbi:helix-turn-helix domain-containing protein [Paracoccus suum]|nr:helix-turn-helix domain-containing protein [Paracoccus suum]
MSQAELARRAKVSQQLISQLERDAPTSTKKLPDIAAALGVQASDIDRRFASVSPPSVEMVPLVSWVSAGQIKDHDSVDNLSDYPTVATSGLPPGRWIGLRVEGFSMSKLSPPDSVLLVNLDDTRLVAGRCYIVAHPETGEATYKAYQPDRDPVFQPLTYKEGIEPPAFPAGVRVIGRVYRSYIDL